MPASTSEALDFGLAGAALRLSSCIAIGAIVGSAARAAGPEAKWQAAAHFEPSATSVLRFGRRSPSIARRLSALPDFGDVVQCSDLRADVSSG